MNMNQCGPITGNQLRCYELSSACRADGVWFTARWGSYYFSLIKVVYNPALLHLCIVFNALEVSPLKMASAPLSCTAAGNSSCNLLQSLVGGTTNTSFRLKLVLLQEKIFSREKELNDTDDFLNNTKECQNKMNKW